MNVYSLWSIRLLPMLYMRNTIYLADEKIVLHISTCASHCKTFAFVITSSIVCSSDSFFCRSCSQRELSLGVHVDFSSMYCRAPDTELLAVWGTAAPFPLENVPPALVHTPSALTCSPPVIVRAPSVRKRALFVPNHTPPVPNAELTVRIPFSLNWTCSLSEPSRSLPALVRLSTDDSVCDISCFLVNTGIFSAKTAHKIWTRPERSDWS